MIRTRRLKRDYEKIASELRTSEVVQVQVVAGDPPSHYQATYQLSSLMWNESTGETAPIAQHIVDIYLPLGYPKQAPRCIMRTPIWHPNIGDYVCIGDYWSAGVTLVDIIAHIGDMIQYRSYNLRSPVNKAAALWAQRNTRAFPVGTKQVVPPMDDSKSDGTVELIISHDGLDIDLGPVKERGTE